MTRHFLPLFILILSNLSAEAATITGEESGIELVQKLAAIRADTLAKAGPYTAHISQDSTFSLTRTFVKLKMEFLEQRNGNLQSVTRTSKGTKLTADRGEEPINEEERLIIGESDIAYWHVDNTFAYIWPRRDYDQMPSIAQVLLDGTHARDLMKYTYGWGSFNFQSLAESMGQGKHVDAKIQSSFGKVFALKLTVGDPASPDYSADLKIDGNQGYLVTSASMFDGDGVLMEQVLVSGREYEPGIWLPESWQHDIFRYPEANGVVERVPADHSVSRLTSLSLHQELAPITFTPLGLDLPNGTRVLSGDSNETMQLTFFESGAFISPDEHVAAASK